MGLLQPQTVGMRGSFEAIDKALTTRWSIVQYERIAQLENSQHLQRVLDMRKMFEAAAQVIAGGADKLKADTINLTSGWDDETFEPAFQNPVTGYLTQLEKSKSRLGTDESGHLSALSRVESAIKAAFERVPPLLKDHQTSIQNLLRIRADLAWASVSQEGSSLPGVALSFSEADAEIDRLEQIDMDGYAPLATLDAEYRSAAGPVQAAASNHQFDGPAAGSAPVDPRLSPSAPGGPGGPGGAPPGGPGGAPPGAPEGAPPGGAPPGGAPPGGAPPGGAPPGGAPPGGAPPGGAPPGGAPPGGAPPGGGDPGGVTPPDTGLAGAPPATIPPPTIPEVPGPSPSSPNLPGSTSPGGPGPLGGVGGGPIAAGLGGASRPGTGGGGGGPTTPPEVQQAARNLSSPQGAGNGQAPSLSGLSRGSSVAGAGTGLGGVPPMMPPPMMPGMGGDGNGKPKPGTAQPTGPGRTRPAGGAAGVPAGLRGRTGGGDGQRRAAPSRARREQDQQNPNVELLDSELWEVDQPKPASPVSERRRVREY